ncbi:OprO/OprP family phosphate-selective porin [Pseudokordiimonas caeni]|uniref:OprO/OprP family phosphate-selective porin n=1 Tax=Pseudokordiimonas caeni TaxID=2997908 RepID=UPI00281114D7|nr:porin [Pseudokordiimonas caeni]
MKRSFLASGLFSLLFATSLTPPALAQSSAEDKETIARLEARVAALETLVQKLVGAGSEVQVAEKRDVPANVAVVASKDPAPAVATADGSLSFNIRGRMMADWGMGSDDRDTFDYSGTKLRAAWFGLEGKAAPDIAYRFEADFGTNSVSVKDAFVAFTQGDWTYTVGHSKVPNSLEWLTPVSLTSVLERSAFRNAFGLERGMGIKASTEGENWGFTAGVFQGTNEAISNTDEGVTTALRGTYGGKLEADGAWMVGLSGRWRKFPDARLAYRTKGTSNQSGTLLSFTGQEEDMMVGAEAAFSNGPFYGAAEFAVLDAKDIGAAGESGGFSGGYAEIGYILTGETRPLDPAGGVWGRPKVANPFGEGGSGLWMLTGRYDRVELNGAGINGGEMESYILSLSWYMNRYLRTIVEYGHSDVSIPGLDNGADMIGLRLGVDW